MKWHIVGALAVVLLPAATAPADEPKLGDRQIDGLIARLGSDSFEEREEATRRLLRHEEAIPSLRRACQSPDAEVARRAREILESLARRAGASGADKVKGELKKLQGEWPLLALEVGGHGGDRNQVHNRLVIEGDKLTIYRVMGLDEKKKPKVQSNSFRIKLVDPTASPKSIDLIRLDGPGKGQVVECVYDVDDTALGLCLPGTNEPRPDGLYTIVGVSDRWLYKCKRPKKPDAAAAKEMKKFNGTWLVTGYEHDGRQTSQRVMEQRKWVYVISDGKLTSTLNGKEGDGTATFELVDIKATPKRVEVHAVRKLDGSVRNSKGIYKLDGDELTLCFNEEADGWPTVFATKPKTTTTLFTLKRQKP
jgi:uncharacterized protein (TIGR03067 family)